MKEFNIAGPCIEQDHYMINASTRLQGVEELIDYLLRKQSWIGDYEGRHEAGWWIASTRVEKWNDTAASERCKHRGMSWTETGVLAMALHASEKNATPTKFTNLTPRNTPPSER